VRRPFLILILIILFSCRENGNNEGEILARVDDNYLYSSELAGIVPKGTPVKDSLIITKNFINNWVREKLILRQAMMNLPEEQLDFRNQIDDYRNSLIIFQYKSLLVNQKLDTNISETEVGNYYSENENGFVLRENIVRCCYLKLFKDTTDVRLYRNLLRTAEDEQISLLDSLCHAMQIDCFLNYTQWVPFNRFISRVPVSTADQESYLRNNRYVEIEEGPYLYLVRFFDYRLSGMISPLLFEEANIKRILLNKRKIDLLNKMEGEIFKNALENNIVEIY